MGVRWRGTGGRWRDDVQTGAETKGGGRSRLTGPSSPRNSMVLILVTVSHSANSDVKWKKKLGIIGPFQPQFPNSYPNRIETRRNGITVSSELLDS